MALRFLPLLVLSVTCFTTQARASQPAHWKMWELGVEGGYRLGGKMSLDGEEGSANGNVRTRSAVTFGGKVSYRMQEDGFVYLWYSREDSTLEVDPDGSSLASSERGLSVEYFHFGGYVQGDFGRAIPFMGVSVGATRFHSSSIGDEWSPSVALDLGLKIPLGDLFQLRGGGRLPTTFNTGSSEIFCVSPSGCATKLEGKPYVQGELYLGLGVNF